MRLKKTVVVADAAVVAAAAATQSNDFTKATRVREAV